MGDVKVDDACLVNGDFSCNCLATGNTVMDVLEINFSI